jgi:hypothetical protein
MFLRQNKVRMNEIMIVKTTRDKYKIEMQKLKQNKRKEL